MRYRFARQAETLGKSVYGHAPGAIMLSAGSGYPMSLPDVLHEPAEAARHEEETMQYGPLMGLDDLRDCIAAYVAEDGITCSRENILATNGAKHATELALRVFTEPGDRIIVLAPTYMTTLQTSRNYGLNLLEVPQDGEGLDADQLETRLRTLRDNGEPLPKLLFDISEFHNPTGITMSLERRKRLIENTLEYKFVIVEDGPYRSLRFEGEPIPPIKSLDAQGIVIAVGTV